MGVLRSGERKKGKQRRFKRQKRAPYILRHYSFADGRDLASFLPVDFIRDCAGADRRFRGPAITRCHGADECARLCCDRNRLYRGIPHRCSRHFHSGVSEQERGQNSAGT